MIDKITLRKKFKKKLSAQTDYIAKCSRQILEQLKEVILSSGCRKILLYSELSIEPKISRLYRWCWERDLVIFLPAFVKHEWCIRELNEYTRLVINRFGMKQPSTTQPPAVLPSFTRHDMIITPGLAFSKDKYRLGHGSGFYDRLRLEGTRIGVCIEDQLTDRLPVKEHDIPMDTIITEERVIF